MGYTQITVKDSNSKLSFKFRDGSRKGRPWWIHLDYGDDPIYLISNVCDTCEILLDRGKNINTNSLTPEEVGQQLRTGMVEVSPAVVDTVATILPDGNYLVNLVQVIPQIGQPYNQTSTARRKIQTEQYWWEQNLNEYKGITQKELIQPLLLQEQLNHTTIETYKTRIKNGEKPTALALSIFDVRSLSGKAIEYNLIHFLLDGHHKMAAAAELGLPINILSFLWKDWWFSNPKFAEDILKLRYEQ